MSGAETVSCTIPEDQAGQRLDKALSALCPDLSRARLQALVKAGDVNVNGRACKQNSIRVEGGDVVEINIPPPAPSEPEAENIPLDIVFEDEHMLVINKPTGLVVHPGAGNWTGTMVNALLYHCGDSLSGIGGVVRPGIVHRLDKDTSGLMVVAKTDQAHQHLSAQLADRSLSRVYHALCFKVPMPPSGTVDQPIGRHPQNRLKMTVTHKNAREAVTYYSLLESYGEALSLVECKLETGRTHQIRVHMEWRGYPLIGDPLYGAQPTGIAAAMRKESYGDDVIEAVLAYPYQALHARKIAFIHPVSGEEMVFEADYHSEFADILEKLV